MRTRLLVVAAGLVAMLGLTGSAAATIPLHATGWDPADGPPPAADEQHGAPGGHLPASSENVELVGKVELTGVAGGISDVGTFGKYAYLGAFNPECAGRPGAQGTGVHIVDISDPSNPTKVGFVPAHPNNYVGEGVQAFRARTAFFDGTILLHNNEACNTGLPSLGGLSLWDVTDPTSPTLLSQGIGDNVPAKPNQTASHTHSTFGWWDRETGKAYAMATDNNELGDVDIFDITNPAAPVHIAETGFNDWPGAQAPLANGDTVFLHDMQVKKIDGQWLGVLSYWDAGFVILDLDDPANPVFVDDSNYPTPDPLTGFDIPEGNGHQAWWSSNNRFIVGTDEDFSPTRTSCEIVTGPNAGATPCGEFGFTPPISTIHPGGFSGSTVWGGSGCVEDVNGNGTSDRAELPSQAATGADAAVFTRGVCFFSDKIRTAEEAGYTMVFIGQSHTGSRGGLLPDGFICGGQGSPILGTAAAGCIGHRAMHQLFADAPEYTSAPEGSDMPAIGALGEDISAAGGVFDGWGYVHLLDAQTLEEIDSYAVPEALDPAFATGFGNLTVHEVQTDPRENVNLAYFSYYDAGFRVAKFGRNGIHEVGHFIDEGGNDFWGIEPTQLNRPGRGAPHLLLSDRDYGLYILRYSG